MTIAKKTLAVFLAFVILTCNLTTLAQNNFSTETNAAIIQTLQYMEPQKEHYGLADIDFTQLSIGSQLYAYEYSNDSYVPTSYDIYPLLIQNQIVALALIREDETGRKFAQIDTLLANKIADVIQPDEAFFILYDDDSCFYVSQNRIVTLNQDSSKNTSRSSFTSAIYNTKSRNVSFSAISIIASLSYTNQSSRSANDDVFLSIEPQYQPQNSKYCWACCVATIGNYLTNIEYTGIQVARSKYGNNYNNQGGTILDARERFQQLYHIDYLPTDHVDYITVSNNLSYGYPLYVECIRPNYNIGHAVVICGENMTSGYLTIMDPDYSSGYVAVYPSNGVYSYISSISGATLIFSEIARYNGVYNY